MVFHQDDAPVLISLTSNDLHQISIRSSRMYSRADAIMLLPPYYISTIKTMIQVVPNKVAGVCPSPGLTSEIFRTVYILQVLQICPIFILEMIRLSFPLLQFFFLVRSCQTELLLICRAFMPPAAIFWCMTLQTLH